jgi:hypothetical protein
MKKIILITLFALSSCQSSKLKVSQNEKFDSQAKKIISAILENDGMLKKGDNNFHVKFDKINDNYYIVDVVFDDFQPKEYTQKFSYLGYNTYLYVDKNRNNYFGLDITAFFIPDSIMMEFLIYTEDDKILNLKKLTLYDYK